MTDDPVLTTIEVALHACGIFASDPQAACAFAVTCDAPIANCDGAPESSAAPFTIEAACQAGNLSRVSMLREATQFANACDREAAYAATDNGYVFRATDREAAREVRLYERTIDETGARIVDIEHQLFEGAPSQDFFMSHFVDGRITRREWFGACDGASEIPGSCPYRIVHFSHDDAGAIEMVEVDADADGVPDERYVLIYEDGRIARAHVQFDGGQVEDVLVASCCLDGGPCTDGLTFNEHVFTKAVE